MRKNGKHTLVIDGNFFLFRTLHVLPPPTKGKLALDTKNDVAVYVRKLATDLTYQIRQFEGVIDQVVWTLDSRSWRKDFYPDAEYKGNRTESSTLNWENFSHAIDEFKQILHKKGIIISKVGGAEGDDLIYAWNTECMTLEKSVIMLTGDRDLIQLVHKNEDTGTHAILYSPIHKKLYTPQGFTKWLNDETESQSNDLFDVLKTQINVEEQVKKHFHTITKNFDVIEIDSIDFSFIKVLTGDGGDNVPSAYWYILTTNGKSRKYGISENKAVKIIDEFKQKHNSLNILYLFNKDYIDDLANITVKIMNAKYMSKETIIQNIINNVNLMILNSKTIPESILDEMFKHIESNISKKSILSEVSTMNKLLEGSEYVKEASTRVSASIFKNDSDDGDDFSFIKDKNNNTNSLF
jgi:5'-3' exonuclease